MVATAVETPRISRPVLRFFRFIVRGYFRRQFRAVRLAHPERWSSVGSGPLIVYANHSSWWDPMVQVLLAEQLFAARRHFAPMDAEALDRYRIFRKLGVFGVDLDSPRGAAQFLRTGLKVLADNGVLWVTPQGRFADPRERPLGFRAGLAALASRVPGGCTLLPLAIEYPFWNERLPECLLLLGEPVRVDGEKAAAIEPRLEGALLESMAELETLSIRRDPAPFTQLLRGRVGTGGFYEAGQRVLALLRGQRFHAEHSSLTRGQRS